MIRTEHQRKAKISFILEKIRKLQLSGHKVLKNEIVGDMCLKDGMAPRTAKEYVKTLIDTNLLKQVKTDSGVQLIAVRTK